MCMSQITHTHTGHATALSWCVQVALKVLKCWQGIVVNSQDVVKPYLQGLLPPVVGAAASVSA